MHGLLTDRYELAMLGAWLREGMAERRGVFELSVRHLPPARRFLVVAGIDRIVRHLTSLTFSDAQVEYLRSAPGLADVMTDAMANYLLAFRFRGDLDVIPEGDVAFGGEPLLRIEASLAEGQILGSFLLGAIHAETRVASKAARVVLAAAGRSVLELGARRVDPLAAPHVARAAYVAGCAATSCEEAGHRYGVPVAGTHAHSYVLAHIDDGEEAALRAFAEAFSGGAALLIDTYDTLRGAVRAANAGPSVRAVQLGSGDLGSLGGAVRGILDAAGRSDVKLVASDDLDEHRIRALVESGAPYDSFGVGTAIALTPDAPSLDAVYRLVEIDDRRGVRVPVSARAGGGPGGAGARQVFRRRGDDGGLLEDVVGRADEDPAAVGAEGVLVPVLRRGKLVRDLPDAAGATAEARGRCARALGELSAGVRETAEGRGAAYSVRFTDALRASVAADG